MNTKEIREAYNFLVPSEVAHMVFSLCDEVDRLREKFHRQTGVITRLQGQNDNQAGTIRSYREAQTKMRGYDELLRENERLQEEVNCLQDQNDRQFKLLEEKGEQLKGLMGLNDEQNDAIQSLINDLTCRDKEITRRVEQVVTKNEVISHLDEKNKSLMRELAEAPCEDKEIERLQVQNDHLQKRKDRQHKLIRVRDDAIKQLEDRIFGAIDLLKRGQ